MKLADDVDHHGRYACPGQHLPQQFSVDRVVGLLEVDEAHVQRDFPLSTQFLQSADYEQHVDGGSRRPEAALLLRQYLLCFAEVAKAIGDDLQQYFAGVGDEWNPSEVVAVRSVRLLVEHLDRCVFPQMWNFLPSSHTDENGVEMLENDGFAGGVVQFE